MAGQQQSLIVREVMKRIDTLILPGRLLLQRKFCTLFYQVVPSNSDFLASITLTWYVKVLISTSVIYQAVCPFICGPPYRDAFHGL